MSKTATLEQAIKEIRQLLATLNTTTEQYNSMQLKIDSKTAIEDEIGIDDVQLYRFRMHLGIARELTEVAIDNYEEAVKHYCDRLEELTVNDVQKSETPRP